MQWDVIVIGGGAAGLWAAGTAAARGRRTLVLEKNRKAGVKILMSGGTRCNITHHCDIDGIIQAFGKQGRFLKPALHELPPSAVVDEIERLGVPTKIEETGKVFPVSNHAIDVRDALVRRLTDAGAELRSGVAVTDLRSTSTTGDQHWRVQTSEEELLASSVILCTGGLSYSECGTTGDGYAWTQRAGHSLQPTFPALAPLVSPAVWVHQLKGITLPDVNLRVISSELPKRDPRSSCRGGFLWTHFGCSGPAPMNVSRSIASLTQPHQAKLQIDLVPNVDEAEIEQRLSNATGRRLVHSQLHDWLPRSLIDSLLARANVAEGATLAELPRTARLALIESLKRLCVPLSGTRGYAKAEVTSGGVTLSEVHSHTLASRIAPGLFLCGEILDVDGPIGGFNFQAAFSTGHLAGLNA